MLLASGGWWRGGVVGALRLDDGRLTDETRVERERRVASSRRKKAFEDAESVQKKGRRGGEMAGRR